MPKNLTSILEEGFLITRKKYLIALLLSFLGVFSFTLPAFLKVQIIMSPVLSWVISVVGFVVSHVFFGGLIIFLYLTNKNAPCSVKKALWVGLEKLPVLIMTLILYSLMVFIGTVAFIIPGLLLSVLCLFGFILIYTDQYDPVLALVSSFKLSKDHFFFVSAILLTLGLFITLGNLLVFMIGYLVFISFAPNFSQEIIIILSLLTIMNTFLVPLAYGIMISLLQDIKIRRGSFTSPHINNE